MIFYRKCEVEKENKMEQREVNLEIQSDYQTAREPTLYFEFNKSEYYGLRAVQGERPFWEKSYPNIY